jgi:hypothetical protein
MNITKTIGWLIFTVGLVVIGSTVYYTYNIFTGNAAVPQIFDMEFNLENPNQELEGGIEESLRQMISQQIQSIIPFESANKFANLFTWNAGAWIIIVGGAKISELGIKLITSPTEKHS